MSGSPQIGLIDYGVGNIRSVANALRWVGAEMRMIAAPAEMDEADGLILPGVGAFIPAMARLRERGFVEPLRQWAQIRQRPLLGVCLGMQLLAARGTEDGEAEGLALIGASVTRLAPGPGIRVPHMGWNRVQRTAAGRLWGEREEAVCYFVHAYHMTFDDDETRAEWVTGTAEHGQAVVAMVENGPVMGTQFHPEKSQRDGLAILSAFKEAVAAW